MPRQVATKPHTHLTAKRASGFVVEHAFPLSLIGAALGWLVWSSTRRQADVSRGW